jgi:hypothetical protein
VLITLQKQVMEWQFHEIRRRDIELSRLRDENAKLRSELEKVRDGQPRSAFEVLLMLANDPTQPPATRLRAAEACIAFERPKLSATTALNKNVNLDIGGRLDRLASEGLERARRSIAANKPIWPAPVDLEPEPAA